MLLFLISLIGGVLTVLTPCVLPLLPIIVGGSLSGGGLNRKKAFTIVTSLGVSVILFTLILKASTAFIGVPESVWKSLSGGIIILLGFSFLFPHIWENGFFAKLSAKSQQAMGRGQQRGGFWGDVIIGAALGPVFTTCSPTYFIVLATVLPESFFVGFIYLVAYALGLATALLLVALVGQRIMIKLEIAANPTGWFKRVVGILFLIVGVAVLLGLDKKLETTLLDKGYFDVTQVEHNLLELGE